MASDSSDESSIQHAPIAIARIYPAGPEAEQALDEVITSEGLSEYHKGFVHLDDLSDKRAAIPEIPTACRTGAEKFKSQLDAEVFTAHFLVSFGKRGSGGGALAWRVGKGVKNSEECNRGVELLVVSPQVKDQGVAAQHALIRFHLTSGALMLCGISDSHPVEYIVNEQKEPIVLGAGQKHVLLDKVNRFKLGKLEFRLIYEDMDSQGYTDYVQARDRIIEGIGLSAPHRCLQAVPRAYFHHRMGTIIMHQLMSSGAFGMVYAAVDSRTGEPLAVKELQIKDKKSATDLQLESELAIATSFSTSEGLLQLHNYHCMHNEHGFCGAHLDKLYLISPLAIGDFSSLRWDKLGYCVKIGLLRGPLKGLETLHNAGYMHRDITTRNMLVVSLNPPDAVLCDYGKAIESQSETDSRIGLIPTLAPEVNTEGRRRYSCKIDIWGIGYICCLMLLGSYMRESLDMRKRPNKAWHDAIMTQLSHYARLRPAESNFTDLVRKMLAWEPADRPTAAEALQHPCMRELENEQLPNAEKARAHALDGENHKRLAVVSKSSSKSANKKPRPHGPGRDDSGRKVPVPVLESAPKDDNEPEFYSGETEVMTSLQRQEFAKVVMRHG